ncbi:MAG TPA: DUF4097 family beta strand repeat-containing protein [Gemmatimonadaceae bacterium]
MMRKLSWIAALCVMPLAADAQSNAADGPELSGRRVGPTVPLKIYNPAGSIRVVAWDRDSVSVHSRTKPLGYFFGGNPMAMKFGVNEFMFGVEEPRGGDTARTAHFVVYVPRHSQVAVKTASASIDATDVSGMFQSVSGTIQVRGAASTLDVESMTGNVDVDASASWMRARTSQGRLLIRGGVQDVDASTIDGALDVATNSIFRGRFQSVSGDIRYVGSPANRAIFEFSNHSGAVDFVLGRYTSSVLELSSVSGPIENGLTNIQPVAAGPHSLRLNIGRGEAQVTVRTFKGPIRLRSQQ